MAARDTVAAIIAVEFQGVQPLRVRREHGGSVSQCFRVDLPTQSLFIKLHEDLRVCETEAESLRSLAETDSVRVPVVLCVGRLGNTAYLVMEFLPLTSRRKQQDDALLGDALGRLHTHRQRREDQGFGFAVDNFVGATPQQNSPWDTEWTRFFREKRLLFQVKMLEERRVCTDAAFLRRVRHIAECVGKFFDESDVIQPSLLHGDLWQGNWAFIGQSEENERVAVVFDPACYWGHSEADLAMMALFGDVSDVFYSSYFALVPKARGFDDRVPLYQLYHALNHYNLFGRGYQTLCEELLRRLEHTLRGNT